MSVFGVESSLFEAERDQVDEIEAEIIGCQNLIEEAALAVAGQIDAAPAVEYMKLSEDLEALVDRYVQLTGRATHVLP